MDGSRNDVFVHSGTPLGPDEKVNPGVPLTDMMKIDYDKSCCVSGVDRSRIREGKHTGRYRCIYIKRKRIR